MHFATESLQDELAQRAVRSGARIDFSTYLFILALGPIAFAAVAGAPWITALSVILFLLGWQTHRSYAAARAKATTSARRRAWITEDGVLIDGVLGPTRWGWDCIADVRVVGAYIVVAFTSREALVIPAPEDSERLVASIRARALGKAKAPGGLLLVLAVLYAVSVAVGLVALHFR